MSVTYDDAQPNGRGHVRPELVRTSKRAVYYYASRRLEPLVGSWPTRQLTLPTEYINPPPGRGQSLLLMMSMIDDVAELSYEFCKQRITNHIDAPRRRCVRRDEASPHRLRYVQKASDYEQL